MARSLSLRMALCNAVLPHRVMASGSTPRASSHLIAVVVVPVGFAKQHRRQALGGQLAALDQHLQRRVVVRLRRVIRRFVVVRIGAAIEQQSRQLGVVRDAGRAVDRGLPFGVVTGRPEAAVRIGAGVEQRRRGADERRRARAVEAQVVREAQVDERVAPSGPDRRGRGGRIRRQKPANRRIVAKDRGREDAAVRRASGPRPASRSRARGRRARSRRR